MRCKSIIGGALLASITAVAVKRYFSFRELKKEIDTFPYEIEKPFSWKEYFNMRLR